MRLGQNGFFILVMAGFLFAGCASFTANDYGVSVENVETLRAMSDQQDTKFSVPEFTSFEPNKNAIACRGAGDVTTRGGISFEKYITDALISELKLAGIYSKKAETQIKGHIELIDFSSSIGTGVWTIKAKISSSQSDPFIAQSIYSFESSWEGVKACQQVAQAFSPAVQTFIKTLINDPRFNQLLVTK
jgi:hypothetical protein